MKKKLKRDLAPNKLKKAIKDLTKLSHDYIRNRDAMQTTSWSDGINLGVAIEGKCFDCGKFSSGRDFQCGHWIPSSVGGAILRYHPHNMHGQSSGCNCGYQQEMVKIRYTQRMTEVYGKERLASLLGLKNRTIKADIIFYNSLLGLYHAGVEKDIVDYLESL